MFGAGEFSLFGFRLKLIAVGEFSLFGLRLKLIAAGEFSLFGFRPCYEVCFRSATVMGSVVFYWFDM